MSRLRLLFAGTPDFAAQHLAALLASPHQVVAVLTQPDRPAGRGNKYTPSPVKLLAQQHAIPLWQPGTLRRVENQQPLIALHNEAPIDVMIVVAYGLILPDAVLNLPRYGCLNVHGSLLPRWRGAAPIQRALWAGDQQTGVTIMQMNSGLDCGDILCQRSCPISATDTSATLYQKLIPPGTQALLSTLEQLMQGRLTPQIQDEHQACYAHKLDKQEARLNWQLSASQLERCVRAFNPWPVSHLLLGDEQIKVWQASVTPALPVMPAAGTVISADKRGIAIACGQDVLNLHTVQPAGKKAMSVADFLNSRRDWLIPGLTLC